MEFAVPRPKIVDVTPKHKIEEAATVDKEPAPKGADSSEEVTLLRNEVMELKSQLGKKDTQNSKRESR
jgi:hypothetical protein